MPNAPEQTSIVVGGITVDLDRETLCGSNGEIRLRPKTFAVLRYLLMHRGRVVTKQALIDAVWGETSVTDDSLVQCLIEIRRALGDDDHRLIKTVPRRGYLVADGDAKADVLRASGGPSTTLGTGPSTRLGTGPSTTLGTGPSTTLGIGWRGKVGLWSLLAVLAGGGAAAAMYLRGGSNLTPATRPLDGVPVVAVLPFRTLGPAAVEEYLQIGMADAVITRLSGLKALAVRPTSAVSYHAKEDGDPSVIGRRLRVDHVIDGTIQRSGDRVRVTAQLIEVATGRTKWAETFDEPFIDLFALQDAISTRIAGQLASALTAEERQALVRRHTGSLEAYELYLRGRFFWEKRTEANLRIAIGYFEQALQRDDRFALAYAGLAHCYYVLGTSLAADASLKVLPALRSAALKVAELDDQLAEAHTAMAGLYSAEWNERGEEAAYKRAIELNPNYPMAYLWYGRMLDRRGHYQESLAMRRRAYDLDPLNLQISVALADALYKTGHHDAALKQITRTLELDPEFWDAHHTLGLFHLDRGGYAEAVAAFEKSGRPSSLAHAYARAGDRDRAALLLRRLEHESTRRYVTPVDFAVVYAGLGENDRAFEWLERAFRERVGPVRLLDADARYAPLRADTRYTDLRRRIRDAHGR
jgi:TolB-like protein/DNA-binding winged helix-turn-helix (wHTH) protein